MALEALGGNPCDKLNDVASTGYPQLWISSAATSALSSDEVNYIAGTGGVTKSFKSYITSTGFALTNALLKTPDAGSNFRLLKYMSGSSTATKTLGSVLLPSSKTIVDDYFVEQKPNYLSLFGITLTDQQFDPIIAKLISEGILLSEADIYDSSQLALTDQTRISQTVDNASLLFLSKTEQAGNLSDQQRVRKVALEEKNLRFFAAFLAEYCFYRTRYQRLLGEYFRVYTIPATSYTAPAASTADITRLFSGTGTGPTQYEGNSILQKDYLKILAYHMAIVNTRMTDMRRLLGSINTFYSNLFTRFQVNINSDGVPGSNSDLQNTISALKASAKESKKYVDEAKFSEGVMKYTQEKNKYSNILLGLYAVLNIAALAMIYKLK